MRPRIIVLGGGLGGRFHGPTPAFALKLEAELHRRKSCQRVPINLVMAERHTGRFGPDHVGDDKSLLESTGRKRHMKGVANARVKNSKTATPTTGNRLRWGRCAFDSVQRPAKPGRWGRSAAAGPEDQAVRAVDQPKAAMMA
jgi:hypothetical protein